MKRILILSALILLFISCQKREWGNPFDPNCPKELFTPTSFTATQMGDSIVLSWSQPNNQISGFVLEKNTADGSFTQLANPEKSTIKVADRNIEGGIKYGYQLYAHAGSNNSNTVAVEITPLLNATITTTAFADITATTAISGGKITADGGAAITARGVCWSTAENPMIANSKTTDGIGKGSFTSSVTGLTAGTVYYARAYATNSVGTVYGNQIKLTTSAVLPTISTASVSVITATTATIGGNISSDGGAVVTVRGVCWSITANPTTANAKTSDGTGTGIFVSNIPGLTPGATYYIKAYATNSIGTVYGNEVTTKTTAILPMITTSAISAITSNSATSGGNINNDGGAALTVRGVCWSTSQNPTIMDFNTSNSTGTGSFISNLTGLTPGITYYLRAYATNIIGTAYGSEFSFKTTPLIVTDIDGNIYSTVKIGIQVWMIENLKTTKYSNGDLIGTTSPATLLITAENTPKYQWAYSGDESSVATYGRLYTWFTVMDTRGVCPTGWHIANDAEWTTLTTILGGESISDDKLKETGTIHWLSPNSGSTNSSGFTALPGGSRYLDGTFNHIGVDCVWWSATEASTIDGWYRRLDNGNARVGRYADYKWVGLSVRCIKD